VLEPCSSANVLPCGGEDDEAAGSDRGGSINVAIVDIPNTQDLARLTPSMFTRRTNIDVN
jgi:hypothetical protein